MASAFIKSKKHVILFRTLRENVAIQQENNELLEENIEKDEQIAWLECELLK